MIIQNVYFKHDHLVFSCRLTYAAIGPWYALPVSEEGVLITVVEKVGIFALYMSQGILYLNKKNAQTLVHKMT